MILNKTIKLLQQIFTALSLPFFPSKNTEMSPSTETAKAKRLDVAIRKDSPKTLEVKCVLCPLTHG